MTAQTHDSDALRTITIEQLRTLMPDADWDTPAGRLRALDRLGPALHELMQSTVEEWRESEHVSWAVIGKALGVTRQAVWERFARGR